MRHHRITLRLLLCVLSVLGTFTSTQAQAQEASACEAAEAWAAAHVDSLPTTFPEFAQLPLAYRKATYARLGPEARTPLWHEHLRVLAETQTYTPDQRALIAEFRGLLDAGLLFRPRAEGQAAVSDLTARVRSAFGERARAVFATIGPEETSMQTAATRVPDSVGAMASVGGAIQITQKPQCVCSMESDYCGFWSGPSAPTSICNRTRTCAEGWGCGTGLLYYCNGMCAQ